MSTKTLSTSSKEEILKNNLEHTIFSWSKQSGLNPLNIASAKGVYLTDRNVNECKHWPWRPPCY